MSQTGQDQEQGQVSGNPGGRPKRKVLTDKLLSKLLETDEAEAEKLVTAILRKAQAGDMQAFNSIRDMVDGKPIQQIEQTDENGNPPCITVRFV